LNKGEQRVCGLDRIPTQISCYRVGVKGLWFEVRGAKVLWFGQDPYANYVLKSGS
jgi:hypothetical protein